MHVVVGWAHVAQVAAVYVAVVQVAVGPLAVGQAVRVLSHETALGELLAMELDLGLAFLLVQYMGLCRHGSRLGGGYDMNPDQ